MAMSVLYSACMTPRTLGGCGVETSRICVCACMYFIRMYVQVVVTLILPGHPAVFRAATGVAACHCTKTVCDRVGTA